MADVAAAAGPVSQPRPSDYLQAPPIGSCDSLLQNIAVAKAHKEAGNEAYGKKNIKRAIVKYHAALLCIKLCNPKEQPGTAIKAQVERLRADCYNNLAACLLLQPNCDYSRVIEYCSNTLRVLPKNTKAMYRKGVAHYHLRNYSLARQYLDDAKKLRKVPDEEIEHYLKLCIQATEKRSDGAEE